jgi:hypothetical protein
MERVEGWTLAEPIPEQDVRALDLLLPRTISREKR